MFSNPASVVQINEPSGFFHYQIPKVADYNAGGRAWSVGMLDGGSRDWKGGFSYSRVAKARILQGRQGYIDRSEFRFATGHTITETISAGVNARWISVNNSNDTTKYLEGDLGALFPLFSDLKGGLTFENLLNKEDETPQTFGAGLNYSFGYGINVFADGYRLMSGTKNGERGWALAAEMTLTGSFLVRAGLFEEAYRGLKGWAAGASWLGPRMLLDYALKSTGSGPKEKSHTLGMSIML